jgi:hypothetical protein
MMMNCGHMRTVNLSILATAFSGQAKEESNYKRLISSLIWAKFGSKPDKIVSAGITHLMG